MHKERLSNVAEIIMGTSPKGDTYNEDGTGKPLLNGPTEFGQTSPNCTLYTTNSKKECRKGDLIFCVRGSTTGRMNWADKEYSLGRGVCAIRGKTELETRYIKYAIDVGLEQLLKYAGGGTFPNLTKATIHDYEIPFAENRFKIASILSAFDDLIENNIRRIAILEEMARLIYREWFVHYRYPGHEEDELVDSGSELGDVPKVWEILEARELIEFNPRTSIDKDRERPYLPMGGVLENSMVIDDSEIEMRTGGSGTKFQNLDTLFARITPSLENGKTGFVQFLNEGQIALGSTEFIVMRSRELNPYYVYCLARDDQFRETAIKSMTGASGRQRVKVNSIKEYKLPLPSQKVLDAFNRTVKPMFEQIHVQTEHNKKLKLIRDLLLPKFISGKVGV